MSLELDPAISRWQHPVPPHTARSLTGRQEPGEPDPIMTIPGASDKPVNVSVAPVDEEMARRVTVWNRVTKRKVPSQAAGWSPFKGIGERRADGKEPG